MRGSSSTMREPSARVRRTTWGCLVEISCSGLTPSTLGRRLARHDVSVGGEGRPQLEVDEDAHRRAAAVEQLQLRRHQVQRPQYAYGAAYTAAPELARIARRRLADVELPADRADERQIGRSAPHVLGAPEHSVAPELQAGLQQQRVQWVPGAGRQIGPVDEGRGPFAAARERARMKER